ncbi:MAG: polysaccharide biosynthesis tyrosine autokinase [Geminicoccaceae bacterium]
MGELGPAPRADHRPGAAPAEAALLGFARLLWRRRWLILATTLLTAALGAGVVSSLEDRFRAEVKLVVDSRVASPAAKASDFAEPMDSEAIQGEIEILLSRDLAHEAVRSLRLTEDPEFNPLLRPTSLQSEISAWVARMIALWLGEEAPVQARASAEGVTVEAFAGQLSVSASGQSRVIRVGIVADSAARAAEIANSYANLYLRQRASARIAAVDSLSSRLGERIAATQLDLRTAEQRVDAFRRQAKLGREAGAGPLTQQMTELNVQLVAAHAARIQANSRLAETERLLRQGRTISVSGVQDSQVMAQLRTQETETARRVADLSQSLGNRHPQMNNARAELAEVQRKIGEETSRAVDGLRDEAAVAAARVTALENMLADLQRQVGAQNAAEVEAREFERDATARRQVLDILLARTKDLQEAEGFRGTDAKLISRADPPLAPFFPNKPLMLTVAGIAGAALGVFLALLIETLRNGYRSIEEVESELGVSGLVLIPHTRRPVNSLLRRSRSSFAESLLALAIELGLPVPTARGTVLVVTSPSPGDGKTTLAVSLARIMIMNGKKVLLIDADLRRPSVHATLGIRIDPGLGDVLAGMAALEQAIVPDRASPLDVLPAGMAPQSPIRLLGSDAMASLIERARSYYDLVIIDTPPLLPVADARLLGRLADKVVLVLWWGRTKRGAARLALKYLAQSGAPLTGVVVSRVDIKYHRSYGYSDSAAYSTAALKYYAG